MATVSVNGRSIHYSVSGAATGPTLVLIHGAGGRAGLWDEIVRHSSDVRTLAVDLPGHGASSLPGRRRVADYARAVGDLLRDLSVTDAIWVGHSLGGAIALEAAAAGDPSVNGLILLGCAATMRVGSSLFTLLLNDYEKAVEFIIDVGWSATAATVARDSCREAFLATAPTTTYGDFFACHQFDLRPRLSHIHQPALVISGSADQLVPHRFAAALADELPHGTLLTLDGASHFAVSEQPETVAAAITAFVTARPA